MRYFLATALLEEVYVAGLYLWKTMRALATDTKEMAIRI
jgi:hypothetical protein